MGEKGEGSGVVGGGKWGRRGREVGGKGEGTGNGVPPCPPPHNWPKIDHTWSVEIKIIQYHLTIHLLHIDICKKDDQLPI